MMQLIEGWAVDIVIAISGVAGTYSVLRSRVARLEQDLKEHLKSDEQHKKELDTKVSAQFKRIDETQNRCTILEQNSKSHLDITTAEEKFVSKYELELILKNIEIQTNHTNRTVDKIEGKLEELVSLLSVGENR